MLSPVTEPDFQVKFASSDEELRAAQSLRYDVFVRELGAKGALIDHEIGLERDHFDDFSKHLLLLDQTRAGSVAEQIVGVYRLLDRNGARAAGGFYSEYEFDLTPLIATNYSTLELGRSCVHPQYRGGMAMYHLWSAISDYVLVEKIDVLFGVASFIGAKQETHAAPLSFLQTQYLAPENLRPVALAPCVGVELSCELDRKSAMIQIPSLIKAYLRLGGYVGQGAYLDHKFNTTDVCLVLDVAKMSDKQRKIYTRKL